MGDTKELKEMMNFQELESCLRSNDSYLIYGAGIVSYGAIVAIREFFQKSPYCAMVTEHSGDSRCPDDIKVITPEDLEVEKWNLPLIIATPEMYHEQIISNISRFPVKRYACLNTHMEYCLMGNYFNKKGIFPLLAELSESNIEKPIDVEKAFSIFMAKSHKDKLLTKRYTIPEWIIPVQAGAACTDQRMDILTDDTGGNISHKNSNYCELTVTYWACKNRTNLYKGICHYRRMLLLSKQDMIRCIAHDVDVILPLPFICYPNATGQYGRYVTESDKKCLERALQEISPEFIDVLRKIDQGPYFYNYNMLIAKENVFDEYCKWMFDVLKCVEAYCEPEGRKRADRYAGYLGEVLTTLYFAHNQDRLKIVHAEKNWMV